MRRALLLAFVFALALAATLLFDSPLLYGSVIVVLMAVILGMLVSARTWSPFQLMLLFLLVAAGSLGLLRFVLSGAWFSFAGAALFVVFLVAASLVARWERGELTVEDEIMVEEVKPRRSSLLVTHNGSRTYHRIGCRKVAHVDGLIEISHGEASAFGLLPCSACRP